MLVLFLVIRSTFIFRPCWIQEDCWSSPHPTLGWKNTLHLKTGLEATRKTEKTSSLLMDSRSFWNQNLLYWRFTGSRLSSLMLMEHSSTLTATVLSLGPKLFWKNPEIPFSLNPKDDFLKFWFFFYFLKYHKVYGRLKGGQEESRRVSWPPGFHNTPSKLNFGIKLFKFTKFDICIFLDLFP